MLDSQPHKLHQDKFILYFYGELSDFNILSELLIDATKNLGEVAFGKLNPLEHLLAPFGFYIEDTCGNTTYVYADYINTFDLCIFKGKVNVLSSLNLTPHPNKLTLLATSGFTFGHKSLSDDLLYILPLTCTSINSQKTTISLYRYIHTFQGKVASFDRIYAIAIETIRLISTKYKGNVYLGLTGGLDSRFLLLSLLDCVEASRIKCFSFGTKNNPDALQAKLICKALGVQWIDLTSSNIYYYFFSKLNRQVLYKYLATYSPLLSLPFIEGFFAYYRLAGIMNESDLIILGQSGDYISGSHLLDNSSSNDSRLESYIKKHQSLVEECNRAPMPELYAFKDKSSNHIESNQYFLSYVELVDRQSKYIKSIFSLAAYFGLNIELPLWYPRLVYSIESNSHSNLINQSYYNDFVEFLSRRNSLVSPNVQKQHRNSGLIFQFLLFIANQKSFLNTYAQLLVNISSKYGNRYLDFGLRFLLLNAKSLNKTAGRNPVILLYKFLVNFKL